MGMPNNINPDSDEIRNIQPRQGIWRTYDGTDGLPPGHYHCLLQDRQGYLWLGAEKGLCRYDGVRFITYTTEDGLPANSVTSICQDSQGCLWIGTDVGVSCYDGERFTNYSAEDGLVDAVITSICEDSQKRLWFGTRDGGVSCYDGERFINYTTQDGLANRCVWAICEDSQERLWFATMDASGWGDGVVVDCHAMTRRKVMPRPYKIIRRRMDFQTITWCLLWRMMPIACGLARGMGYAVSMGTDLSPMVKKYQNIAIISSLSGMSMVNCGLARRETEYTGMMVCISSSSAKWMVYQAVVSLDSSLNKMAQ